MEYYFFISVVSCSILPFQLIFNLIFCGDMPLQIGSRSADFAIPLANTPQLTHDLELKASVKINLLRSDARGCRERLGGCGERRFGEG
jgi:hypothetical protein